MAEAKRLAVTISAIAVLALAPLAPFLCLDAQGGDGTRFKPLDADLLAGFQAVAVGAVLGTLQRLIDLADELAFAVPGAQLQAEFLFLRRPVIRIGEVRSLVFHVRDGAIDLDHEVTLPVVENGAEVLELRLAHVQLAALDDVRLYVARACQQAPGLVAVLRVGAQHANGRAGHRQGRGAAATGRRPRWAEGVF